MKAEQQRYGKLVLSYQNGFWFWFTDPPRGEAVYGVGSKRELVNLLMATEGAKWDVYKRIDGQWGWGATCAKTGSMVAHSTDGWRDKGIASYNMGQAWLRIHQGLKEIGKEADGGASAV